MPEQPIQSEQRTIALLIEYDGTQYAGWQRQNNAPTIQEYLERIAGKFTGSYCPVIGSGRTDAGVHAFGQVAHLHLPVHNHLPTEKLPLAFNRSLPRDINIRAACEVNPSFHARFGAIRREYRYFFSSRNSVFFNRYTWYSDRTFTPELLQQTAQLFLGRQNFTGFSKHNPDTGSYVCTVERSEWRQLPEDVWEFRVVADRFVYGMVRSLVGVMMDVARGRRSITDVQEALQSCDRSHGSQLAPACGLALWHIDYPEQPFTAPTDDVFPLHR